MASRQVGARTPLVFALLLLACGGESTGPATGSLALAVSGLPSSVVADVSVSGPGGFTVRLEGSETVSGLAPGSYTVAAAGVSAGATFYAPSPASQGVVVSGGGPASAEVVYAVANGSLVVPVVDLPAGTDAAITVSGPAGYSRQVTATETLSGLTAGQYTLTALPVADGSDQYSPAPSSQTVAVGVSGSARATVNYSTGGAAGFNLRVDGLYLVQSVQTFARGVPLVRNRDALLRVFVTANQVNAANPDVRVTFYSNGSPTSTATIPAPGLTTPLGANEGTLSGSWNLYVDEALIQPNLSVVVEVDPDNAFAEGNETDNVFPQVGSPLALEVHASEPFRVRLIPVRTKADNRVGNVTEANKEEFLDASMRMHPLAAFEAEVTPVYTTSTDLRLQGDNGNEAWNAIVSEILAIQASSSSYYYGVVNPPYTSGIAGVGYIGAAAAVGWDKLSSAGSVAAHEWGHNWGRRHAPCGTASNPDADYPYTGGEIGVIGYDLVEDELKPADSHDLMGYCDGEWISDYTFEGIRNFRSAEQLRASGMREAIQPALLVWGRIENGRAVLEPAFRITARPRLPREPGPYRLEGRAADGSSVFGFDFSPFELADDLRGAGHFAFVVPLQAERAARIAGLHLSGGGTRVSVVRPPSEPAAIELTRGAAGRIALRWDAARSPMIMVRDPVSGDVLSLARGGSAEVVSDRDELSVTSSDLRGRDTRIKVRTR